MIISTSLTSKSVISFSPSSLNDKTESIHNFRINSNLQTELKLFYYKIENYPSDTPPWSNSIRYRISIALAPVFIPLTVVPETRKLRISNGSPSSSTFGSLSFIRSSSVAFLIQNFFRLSRFKIRISLCEVLTFSSLRRKKFLSNEMASISEYWISVGKIAHSSTFFLPVARSRIFSLFEILKQSQR